MHDRCYGDRSKEQVRGERKTYPKKYRYVPSLNKTIIYICVPESESFTRPWRYSRGGRRRLKAGKR